MKRYSGSMEESDYWLGFSIAPNIGPKRFLELLQVFGTAQVAWDASENEIVNVIGKVFAKKFWDFKKKFSLEVYKNELGKKGVSFLTLSDSSYPALLKQIPNPPFVLYVKGDVSILRPAPHPSLSLREREHDSAGEGDNTIGIVGTRKITSYGRTVTEMITGELVDSGFTIVSGLALGVDAVAHKTTVRHGGKTIAVLGCGVDCCTPSANQTLYNSIVDGHGCVVSEFPLGMLPTLGSFPSRNRIIAGLSQAVVVTEGAEDSGSLITASKALEFGRPVFAVPGPITSSLSKGPNKLLSEGAKFVTSGKDILIALNMEQRGKSKGQRVIKGDTQEEQKIIDILQNESLHFDEIVKRTGFDSSHTGSLLSIMEMKGIIKTEDSGSFSLT